MTINTQAYILKLSQSNGAKQALNELYAGTTAKDCDVLVHKPSGKIIMVIYYGTGSAGYAEILHFKVTAVATSLSLEQTYNK